MKKLRREPGKYLRVRANIDALLDHLYYEQMSWIITKKYIQESRGVEKVEKLHGYCGQNTQTTQGGWPKLFNLSHRYVFCHSIHADCTQYLSQRGEKQVTTPRFDIFSRNWALLGTKKWRNQRLPFLGKDQVQIAFRRQFFGRKSSSITQELGQRCLYAQVGEFRQLQCWVNPLPLPLALVNPHFTEKSSFLPVNLSF